MAVPIIGAAALAAARAVAVSK